MQQTSLSAYTILKKSGELSDQERLIYECIKDFGRPCTDLELCDTYRFNKKIEINMVSGRRNGLVEKGWVRSVGTKINRTGHRAVLWWLTNTPIPTEEEE